jgi:competence protein ComEA
VPTKAERTALLFLGAVVLAGGAVRLVRAARGGVRPPPSAQAALAGQRRAVDSASVRAPVLGDAGAQPRGSTRPSRRAPRAARGAATERASGANAVAPETPPPAARAPIDVDRASAAELESLPRVGPALAARIIAEREKNGPFGSLAALDARVKGIGPAMVRALQPLIAFSGQ